MPTATTTRTFEAYQPPLSLKITSSKTEPLSSLAPPPATAITLRTLYNRAAHAFLHRDIPLTYSLIESAFHAIHPPLVIPDVLNELRRKWDVLRITLESTVYSTPTLYNESLHSTLKENRIKLPQDFIKQLYSRSLALFTLNNDSTTIASTALPNQVLVTLVYASLRLDCIDFARIMVEDWLARREPSLSQAAESGSTNGYQKVLELYCLQILPKLDQWEYAEEFLVYENELPSPARESLTTSFKSVQAQAMSSRRIVQHEPLGFCGASLETPTSSSRSYSPAPSTSSSSSSLSTTSTHTVIPSTLRGPSQPRTDLSSIVQNNQSTTSVSSVSTATPGRTSTSIKPILKSRNVPSSSSSISRHLSPQHHEPPTAIHRSSFSTYSLIKAYLSPYMTSSSLSTLLLIFIVFPALSLLLRARHRNKQRVLSPAISNASLTRQQLMASRTSAFNRAWATIMQAIFDTVRMAGSGLV